MPVKITEVTPNDRTTFGMRLKEAREALDLTRNQVADQTGIPVKSLEKFETGSMSPNVERLQELAKTLCVSVDYLLNGEDAHSRSQGDEGTDADEDIDRSDEPGSPFERAVAELAALDDIRAQGFRKAWRTGPRRLETAEQAIFELGFEELLDLAEMRNLLAITQAEAAAYYAQSRAAQVQYFRDVAERILDTAYLGVDLYLLDQPALKELAAELELQPDAQGLIFSSWSSADALIGALRPKLRELALRQTGPDFEDRERFPEKKVA